MSTTSSQGAASKGTTPAPATAVAGVDAAARRQAAVLLEVLAGVRTPQQAAQVLGVSLPRYYQLEGRALAGLVEACAGKPRGRQPSVDREVQTLRQQRQRLEREVARQQALVRLVQRSVGVPAVPATCGKEAGKKRKRRPTARALRAAARLRAAEESGVTVAPPATPTDL